MIKNYLAITFRSLRRNKLFSVINILGLSLSLAVCTIIIMVVVGQMNYDQYNTKKDRIYRVNSTFKGNESNVYATTSIPLAEELVDNYTGVEDAVRIRRGFGNGWVKVERDENIPVAGFFVDENFIDLFEYDLIFGDKATALKEPYATVLTDETAERIFGRTDVIGEIIDLGEIGIYNVTGVLNTDDIHSHIKFEALGSYASVRALEKTGIMGKETDNWDNLTAGWVYVLLDENSTKEQIEQNLISIAESKFIEGDRSNFEYHLQSLTDITPGPFVNNAIGPFMPMVIVYFFAGLCLIIILTAGFNYTNLSIAKALSRSKEVGVRKVIGANKWQLTFQFLLESVVIMLLAFGLSLVLIVTYFKPAFEGLLFADVLEWNVSFQFKAILIGLLFTTLVGLLIGFLPASILSSFNPTSALKGMSGKKVMSKVGLRKTLLVVQFALSLIFIITMVLVKNQFDLLITADYGFNPKNVLTIRVTEEDYKKFKNEINRNSAFESVTVASHMPSTGTNLGESIKRNMSDEPDGISYYSIDEGYLGLMEIDLIAGKNFTANLEEYEEERAVLINEEAVKYYQFENAADAVGKSLYLADSTEVQILGVVADYYHEEMMTTMKPLVLRYSPSTFNILQARFNPANRERAYAELDNIYKSIYPNKRAQIETLENKIEEFYNIIFGDAIKIFFLFSTLAIVIASMGLLGMVTYSVQLRLKEVSIRKVLGATVPEVMLSLSKGFVFLLALGIIIAIPSAYFLNNLWLELIAVRVNMNLEIILIGVGIIVLFGALTVGSQTLRASLLNPVKFLKDE